MAPKGKTMLKVVSILYIIFSGISILVGLLALVGGGMIAAGGDMMGAGSARSRRSWAWSSSFPAFSA